MRRGGLRDFYGKSLQVRNRSGPCSKYFIFGIFINFTDVSTASLFLYFKQNKFFNFLNIFYLNYLVIVLFSMLIHHVLAMLRID